MDDEDVTHVLNPLQMTLDEVISLNRLKNQNDQVILEDTQPINEFKKPINGYHKAISRPIKDDNYDDFKQKVENRLRSIQDFGSKEIHQRLGYFTPDLRTRLKASDRKQKLARMRQSIKFARTQQRKFEQKCPSTFNASITVENDLMKPGLLTREAVSVFNRLNGGRVPFSGSSAQSMVSARSTMSLKPKHCIKNILTPYYQQQIKKLSEEISLSKRTRPEDLQELRPTVATTSIPLGVRFFSYE